MAVIDADITETVNPGFTYSVDDEQVIGCGQHLLQGLDAVQRLVDFDPGALKRVAIETAHEAGVVDDQNPPACRFSHAHPPSAAGRR